MSCFSQSWWTSLIISQSVNIAFSIFSLPLLVSPFSSFMWFLFFFWIILFLLDEFNLTQVEVRTIHGKLHVYFIGEDDVENDFFFSFAHIFELLRDFCQLGKLFVVPAKCKLLGIKHGNSCRIEYKYIPVKLHKIDV